MKTNLLKKKISKILKGSSSQKKSIDDKEKLIEEISIELIFF